MIAWSDRELRTLATGMTFLESPRWRDGTLFVSDFYTSRVYTWSEADGFGELCEVPGQPSGLGFTPAGDLLIAARFNHTLWRLAGGRLTPVVDLGAAAESVNDMVVAADGRAYIGTVAPPDENWVAPGTEVLRVDPDGTVGVAADNVRFPNGIVLLPEGRTALVAETFASRISAYDLNSDGSWSGRRVWHDFADGDRPLSTSRTDPGSPVFPDGMTADEDGAVWVADAHGSGVLRLAADGTVLDAVCTGDASAYAVALGGADRRTLFICASAPLGVEDPATTRNSALLSCQVDVPGAGRP